MNKNKLIGGNKEDLKTTNKIFSNFTSFARTFKRLFF